MTLIKICGITNVEDALAAVECGASFLGFVLAESPRRAETSAAKHIIRILAADVKTVGVFTEESDEVVRTMDELGLTYAQLHGGQSEDFARRIGAERVIRAIRVRGEESLARLRGYEQAAFYLLDTYRAGVPGGTGAVFDWNLVVKAGSLGRPIILSGGLRPGNIGEAVTMVRPFAVDVASGVEESPGKKDHQKMKEFVENVRRADAASG